MKEVACRALDVFFRELDRKGLPTDPLLRGVPYPLAHLRNKDERIEWAVFVTIMENASHVWTDDELAQMGSAFFASPLLRAMNVVSRLLFSTRELYGWVATAGTGAGDQLFSGCIEPSIRDVGPGHLVLELSLRPGYAPCRSFFLVNRGIFAALPTVIGFQPAQVEMLSTPQGARYEVRYAAGGGALAKARRALTWPFTIRAAAQELRAANETLVRRYDELERARATLARQAQQLTTAQIISQVIHGDLDLDATITAVASALVTVAGFRAAAITVTADVDGRRVETQGMEGNGDGTPLIRPLAGRRRAIGEVRVWGGDQEHVHELLDAVVPTISMAIDDALTYRALADYRENLEARVEARTAELVAAQEARDRIFANINHDIRTPLSVMTMAVASIRSNQGAALGAQSAEDLGNIEVSVRRLLRLVDQLLQLAAASEHRLVLDLGAVDLATLLERLVSTWRSAAKRQGIELSYAGPEQLIVDVDDLAIDRVVANLVSNAIKFTPAGGRVQVSLAATTDTLEIAVTDTGIGLDEEFRARMFGRFERGRPPVRGGMTGSGLGLSLAKELVEAHGGALEAESPATGGTRFVARLPRRVPVAAAERPVADATAEVTLLSPDAFGPEEGAAADVILEGPGPDAPLVLVAEDEPLLRARIAQVLSVDYRVLVASDGLRALALARKHQPDMLVSDVGMPGLDGIELTRRFREMSGARLAPVVLLTAFAGVPDRLSGFAAGAVDYVIKPFEPDELRARVRSQLALRDLALRMHEAEKLAGMGMLSSSLAHEIRNPANALLNALDPLCALLPPSALEPGTPTAQLLMVLRDCAQQIAALSRQLLGFRRSGDLACKRERLDVLLTRARALSQEQLAGARLEVDARYVGDVVCAGALLTQVFTNLLDNAAYAAGKGGWVRLTSELVSDDVLVTVADSGPGVPAELRARLFEPFFTTKPQGVGTGLGLCTARDIVEKHQGRLEYRGSADGAVFCVRLPVRGPTPGVTT